MTDKTVLCRECRSPLERDIQYGGLRYYVCRGCASAGLAEPGDPLRWAIPYPPGREPREREDDSGGP